eukprot:2917880-Amphidinium_carterae.1
MWNRRVTYFNETSAAQYRRLRKIFDRYPSTVNIFEGVEESVLSSFKETSIDYDEDIHPSRHRRVALTITGTFIKIFR